jgi:hypothetical protein
LGADLLAIRFEDDGDDENIVYCIGIDQRQTYLILVQHETTKESFYATAPNPKKKKEKGISTHMAHMKVLTTQ